jgi:DNA-binding response OmpR family regulator
MKYSVMLVEDEPLIAMLYEDIVVDSEFEILEVHVCNAAALAALATVSPDIVIVDYNLHDGPCLPVVARLKETGTPFIVATGYDDNVDPELGANVWLTTPFRDEDVLSALRAAGTEVAKV